jgi:2-keto-3-deoxy-L-rhamnonate aldolase RhmA
MLSMVAVALIGEAAQAQRLNPLVELLSQKKPAFGIYAPANPRAGRGGRGAPAGTTAGAPVTQQAEAPPPKSPAQLAADAVAYKGADYIFDGSMEGGATFDAAYTRFADFTKGMSDAGAVDKATKRQHHTLATKTHEIAENVPLAQERIAKQLNLGIATIVFVGVESADEVKAGLAAIRFKSKGGVRPDDVGSAPAFWGMSEKEYKDKADLWPLNPNGELLNFTIVESKAGLAKLDEIAAVKGIGVLFPGAGTLRQVFSQGEGADRKFDAAAWENAIQQVLAACKKYNVPCGYPANNSQEMEMRMKQGFSVFISGWGQAGFDAIETGKKLAGR